MKIYNRQLEQMQNLELQNKIELTISKQIEFLIENYGVNRQILEKKMEDLAIVAHSNGTDRTYVKKVDGEIREIPAHDHSQAVMGQMEQNYIGDKCFFKNAIYIDTSFSEDVFNHVFSHELFHYLSSDTEMVFDENNEAIYKSGVSIGKYDKDDNLVTEESRGLNEGITEALAMKITEGNKGEYNIPVKIADILMGNDSMLLINAYFSNDKADVQRFYDEFDKRQNSATSTQLKTMPNTSDYFSLDVNLLKGCLEYAVSFCKDMDELKTERKRLIPIIKSMRDDLNIVYSGEEDFDIKVLFDSIMSTKREEIQSKSEKKIEGDLSKLNKANNLISQRFDKEARCNRRIKYREKSVKYGTENKKSI